jgi:(2Fe-2S) ferredoxin
MDQLIPDHCSPKQVLVCQHTSCLRHGAAEVLKAFEQADLPPNVTVEKVECLGQCSTSPTVKISPDEIWYYRVSMDDVATIVKEHLHQGQVVKAKLNPRIHFPYGF